MSRFVADFKQGLREGPIVFFAPVIAIYRLLSKATREVIRDAEHRAARDERRPALRR